MSSRQDPVRALIATQAQAWFVLHRAGELTATQRQQFMDWLCESPAHAHEYVALAGLVQELQRVAARNETPADILVSRARAEIDVDNVQPMFPTAAVVRATDRDSSRPRRAHVWTAVAAIVTTITALLAGGWWFHERHHYQTAHAEQRSWRMPDGSTVHLNSSSEIRVRFDERQRRVELVRGQALFQVAKDARRPFWVYAGDTAAKAVGTEFDVYRRPDGTLISVLEGRVAVWRLGNVSEQERAPDASASGGTQPPIAQLGADQQVTISRHSAEISPRGGSVRKTAAWLQRQVVFDHDLLGSAIEEFNRYADRRIRVEGSELRALQISGIFSAYDAEAFLRFLERQSNVKVERGAREIVVSASPTTD